MAIGKSPSQGTVQGESGRMKQRLKSIDQHYLRDVVLLHVEKEDHRGFSVITIPTAENIPTSLQGIGFVHSSLLDRRLDALTGRLLVRLYATKAEEVRLHGSLTSLPGSTPSGVDTVVY